MTRRGSLAYYLAAWACGCFFMTVCFVGLPKPSDFPQDMILGLIYLYFLALFFGAFTSLLFGFLLRKIAGGMEFARAWQWIVAGAILAPVLIGTLGSIMLIHGRATEFLLPVQLYFLYAPQLILSGGAHTLWRVIPAGAATAWVLFRIHHAFGKAADGTVG
ncbi:MAG TPA: hypothetical protein VJN21_14255 [Candidatus Acidoferrales bacterium]|nr:hypothetical protein [Candidatus Acidoferrales bacterium]